MGWNLEIIVLICQVLHFLPLEALHLLALYGKPWNDHGGLFWSSCPYSCRAENVGWDKAKRKNVTCWPANLLRAEHLSPSSSQLPVPQGHSTLVM